jgi:tetratricopeptide (TPR) repeat protein
LVLRLSAILGAVAALAIGLLPQAASAQPAAEVVSLQGRGDYRPAQATEWMPARVKLALEGGTFVRTVEAGSKMSLLLVDQTQLTLQGGSIAQVKGPDAAAPRRSIIEFNKGTGRFQTKTPTKDFAVRTPTGVAAIRGTEWLVQVDDDGRSAFTVVEGVIEISNEQGSLMIEPNEEGILEKGRAPSKRRVQNARERVQWVSSFRIDASNYRELGAQGSEPKPLEPALEAFRAGDIGAMRRHLLAGTEGEGSRPVDYFLLADIAIYFGRVDEAIEWLTRARTRFPEDGRADALLARTYLFADDFPRAREAAAAALAKHPERFESQLAAGEVARLDGDYSRANEAFVRATRIAPDDWRGWHALGQLRAERSDPKRARPVLERAERLSPRSAVVLGELGLLEANAYDLPRARETLGRALDAGPDDFVAWTSLGLARLKAGDTEGALESLLKATLLEPRFARAHIYLAVAYWRQGRAQDAFAELRTASVHDPRDPLPYHFRAMIEADLLQPGDALASAREAVARLPYVKSLDPIASNLRGSANLGAPMAQLGLEAWALKNAQDSFDPMWAASHLFLADRLSGKFTSNSELFQGFLADPLAFGASNRFQTLVSGAGQYGTLALRAANSSDARLVEPAANLNGLVDDGRLAYFAEGARIRTWQRETPDTASASSYTVGLGFKPSDDLGFFLYANRLLPESVSEATVQIFTTRTEIEGTVDRVDAGFHYRHGPEWQLWVKAGRGREDSRLRARDRVRTSGAFRDSDFSTTPERRDYGARILGRPIDKLEVSITAEAADWRSRDFLERDATLRASSASPRFLEEVTQEIRDKSRSVAVGARWHFSPELVAEIEADHTSYEKTNDIVVRRDFANQVTPLEDDHERKEWSPRAGVVFKPVAQLGLRAAYQEWLRPAAIASLKPSSTAGIVLDERYVLAGGRLERARVQAEWEPAPNLLFTAFADKQRVTNLYSSLIGVLNNRPDSSNLERLRNRSFNSLASLQLLEGFPALSKGTLEESGISLNALVTRQVSLFAEAVRAKSENTGPQFAGARWPFMPDSRYGLGGTFFSDARWFVAGKAIYRGERFTDEGNRNRLEPEWNGALQVYWETSSKRWSIEAIVTNLAAKSARESVGVAVNYRF